MNASTLVLDATTPTDTGSSLLGVVLFFAILAAYFIPTYVAVGRKTVNQGGVLVVNLLLGWTFLGWVIALAMAAGGGTKEQEENRIRMLAASVQQPAAAPAPAPPVVSPDGKFWWDGKGWQPMPSSTPELPAAPPSPS